jgi:hypothetical protein
MQEISIWIDVGKILAIFEEETKVTLITATINK